MPVMVERDVWLADALNYIAFGSWSERDKWHGEDVAEGEATRILSGLYAAEKLVAQAAFDDKLPIWGRQDEHSLFEQVPAAYWKHYRLDWPTMLEAPSGFAHYPRVAMCHRVVWKGS